METPHFNIQQSIDSYFNSIRQQGSFDEEQEAELRSHLLDTMDNLREKELTGEEAFLIAVKRLGKTAVLAEEYNKLNPAMQPQIIWAYLFIGFGALTSAIWIFSILYQLYFRFLLHHFANTGFGLFLFVTANLLICAGTWWMMIKGRRLTKWLQTSIDRRSWAVTFTVFLLPVINVLFAPKIYRWMHTTRLFDDMFIRPEDELFRHYNSGPADLSYYLVIASFLSVMLLSVVQASGRKFSLRRLFSEPSIFFLILLGFATEIVAAMMRVVGNDVVSCVLFGLIYGLSAFSIAYFNKQKLLLRILIFAGFGLFMEGYFAIRTPELLYFVAALVFGVLAGFFVGQRAK